MSNQERIKNRIVSYGMARVDDILFNPNNWRIHSKYQQEAMLDMLEKVGWTQNVMINLTTGNLVDGHLRALLAQKSDELEIPATYVELSEEEEQVVISAFDPIGAMADADKEKWEELITKIKSERDDLEGMLDKIIEENNLFKDTENDGVSLELFKVTVADPKTQVNNGDVFYLGNRHVLICCSPVFDVPLWIGYLDANMLFVPYASPTTFLSESAQETPVLGLSPEPYICGHILDRYKEVNGDNSVTTN